MTHQAVEVGPGRTQYIFTGHPASEPQGGAKHPVIDFLAQPHTAFEISEHFGYSRPYVTQVLCKHRSQIVGVGMRGHEKIYRAKP